MRSLRSHTGRGAWGGSHSFGRASKTETGAKCIHTSAVGDQRHRPSHVVEAAPARVPTLDPHGRQYLDVPSSSVSPERLFSSVRLVNSDLRGSLLDTTLIDVMWVKQTP